MARPFTATDEQIIDAAHAVMARRGADHFTVSEVAREVGLSRAAITQRFNGVEALRSIVVNQLSSSFEQKIAQLNVAPGAPGLLDIANLVGMMAGARCRFSAFLLDYTSNISDRSRREFEERRGAVLRAAVARVMPPLAISQSAAVDAYMANLIGSLIAWQSSEHPDAAEFLRRRTRDWLLLAGILEVVPVEPD